MGISKWSSVPLARTRSVRSLATCPHAHHSYPLSVSRHTLSVALAALKSDNRRFALWFLATPARTTSGCACRSSRPPRWLPSIHLRLVKSDPSLTTTFVDFCLTQRRARVPVNNNAKLACPAESSVGRAASTPAAAPESWPAPALPSLSACMVSDRAVTRPPSS